ncbi:MAG: mannose-1-phosphate guanylyltransferase [Bacteroidales bacterium]
MDKNLYCVIMAGGVGSRFWPVSRQSRPKQFLDILGTGRSFIQQTYDRFIKIVPHENIMIVTSANYKELVEEQLPDVLEKNILLEPFRRNTAPCITYASYKLAKMNPDAVMIVTPSDHYIANESLYLETISHAAEYAAKHDELFTMGIKPSRPETGYGYIQANKKELHNVQGHIAYGVKTFTEKPDEELAKVFYESGEFLWNSGIFIWNNRTILKEIDKWLPDVSALFKLGNDIYGTQEEQKFLDSIYEDCTNVSIDYGVMEKTSKAWVFEASFGWSDLGTWESLFQHSEKDENNNLVKVENHMMDKMYNSVIVNTEKDKLIAVKGLSDFMIVNTDDVLMICPRDEVRFKNMLTDLAVNDKNKYQ